MLLINGKDNFGVPFNAQRRFFEILGTPLSLKKHVVLRGGDLYFLTSSTRRFCARPASVLLSSTGFVSPSPAVVSRVASAPSVCTR